MKIFKIMMLTLLLSLLAVPVMAADTVTRPPLTAHQEHMLANRIAQLESDRDKAVAERDAYAGAYENEKTQNEALAKLYKDAETKWNEVVTNSEKEIELLKKQNTVLQKENNLLKKQVKTHQSLNVILGVVALTLAIF